MCCCTALSLKAQKPVVKSMNSEGQEVSVFVPSSFSKTIPARDWPLIEESNDTKEKRLIRNDFMRISGLGDGQATEIDPVLQSEDGSRIQRKAIVSFAGQSGSGIPPDPSGAAGPNHYVQAVNTSFTIYNKSGNKVAGPFSLASLFPGSSNLGDPIVMYDRHAERWFISQFNDDPNGILIAISETSDPTGSYYSYSFDLDEFPDYPKYSIWWDGYYMSSNSTHTAVVFEREKMLNGDENAKMISLSLPTQRSNGFRAALPADSDGPLPPNGTPCYFFNLSDNGFGGGAQDQIQVFQMRTNWVTPASSTVTLGTPVSVPSFDAVFSGGFSNISQPGTTTKIDAIQGVLMYRAQHMRWTGYNTMVLSHAVDLGSNRAGIRWYELRDDNSGIWNLFQSGTFSPNNTASRFMSSAAMDDLGNIGMAYSVSDATNTIYPSLYYTGRLANDPLGTMTFAESIGFAGTASQSGVNRFGDYAHLSLDPDGQTFWHTGEYIGGSGSNGSPRTRVFSFNLSKEAGIENVYYKELELFANYVNDELLVRVKGIYQNETVQLDVVNSLGKTISSTQSLKPENGELNRKVELPKVAPGVYFVRIGNLNFQKVVKIQIQ